MIKRTLKSAALLAGAFILAACGSNYANAQTIDLVYKSSDAKVAFSLKDATKIQVLSAGSIRATFSSGLSDIADGTGAVYQAIIADPKFTAQYVQVGAGAVWVNVGQMVYVQCSGRNTRIQWPTRSEDFVDNCATFSAILAKAN